MMACVAALFSSCIEFESEEVAYRYHEAEDALLITLRYEGVFGGAKGGLDDPVGDDVLKADALSEQQVEQIESVLAGGRAFFFSNWISEYNRRALVEALKGSNTALGGVGKGMPVGEAALVERGGRGRPGMAGHEGAHPAHLPQHCVLGAGGDGPGALRGRAERPRV